MNVDRRMGPRSPFHLALRGGQEKILEEERRKFRPVVQSGLAVNRQCLLTNRGLTGETCCSDLPVTVYAHNADAAYGARGQQTMSGGEPRAVEGREHHPDGNR